MIFQRNRQSFPWIPISYVNRPLLSTPNKDIGYDAACGRYYLWMQNNNQYLTDWFRANYIANMNYSIDSQWGEEADARMFLGDGAAQTTRIPFKSPIMSPMLTRLIGGADNVSINASLEPITRHFETRKEQQMNRARAMAVAASQSSAGHPLSSVPRLIA